MSAPFTSTPSQPLTFGIELEFICIRARQLFPSVYDPEEPETVGYPIWLELTDRGVPATGWEDPTEDIDERQFPSHSRWRIESDHLHLSEGEADHLPDDWVAESVELSSRKFDLGRDDWRGEVRVVLDVLSKLEQQGCRFITNKTTGFHVHVGNGNAKIPLRTAKNVFQLATAFERQFDRLHSVSRIVWESELIHGSNHYPLSFFHTYGQLCRDGVPPQVFDRLAAIENVSTYEDLGAMFAVLPPGSPEFYRTTGHNSTLNFDNLFASPDDGRHEENLTGTIEFRQHAGTLDYLTIESWVKLTCQIVSWCSNVSAETMIQLCLHAVEPGYGLGHLLRAIVCPQAVIDHYSGNAEVIGFLGEDGPSTANREHVTLILEQNDFECSDRTDRNTVTAAIRYKFSTGKYGIHPVVSPDFLITTVAAELQKAYNAVLLTGVLFSGEVGESRVRARTFKAYATMYREVCRFDRIADRYRPRPEVAARRAMVNPRCVSMWAGEHEGKSRQRR